MSCSISTCYALLISVSVTTLVITFSSCITAVVNKNRQYYYAILNDTTPNAIAVLAIVILLFSSAVSSAYAIWAFVAKKQSVNFIGLCTSAIALVGKLCSDV